MKKIIITIGILLVGIIIGVILTKVFIKQPVAIENTTTNNPTLNWSKYTGQTAQSEKYSFSYPPGYSVSARDNQTSQIVTIFPASKDEIPAMTINLANTSGQNSITFSLWEGIGWEYYDEVVESFETLD